MKKKSVLPWVLCLVLPIPLLIFTSFLQTIARFSTRESSVEPSTIMILVNIVGLLLGIVAILMLLLLPLWIILLVKAANYNKKLQSLSPNTEPSQPVQVQGEMIQEEHSPSDQSLPPSAG